MENISSSWSSLILDTVPNSITLTDVGDVYYKSLACGLRNKFWKELFLILANLKKILTPQEKHTVSEALWCNSLFPIGKATVVYPDWNERGITNIYDMFDSEGKIYSYDDFCMVEGFFSPIHNF